MKTVMLISIISAFLFATDDQLTGKWETKPNAKGTVTGVIFKPDNTFEGFINKKPFVSSVYKLEGDTITFTDNGCDGQQGVYKVILFSNKDSMRWEPITDGCAERKEGILRLVLGRVKDHQLP
jgi:hypothetical protein